MIKRREYRETITFVSDETSIVMDTRFLYHVFGLVGLKCTRTEYKGNALVLNVEYSKRKIKCPCCGMRSLVKNGYRYRDILTLPVGMKRTLLHLKSEGALLS